MTSIEVWPIIITLLTGSIINVSLLKTTMLQKRGKIIISLFSSLIVASTSVSLYSHYAPEPLHIMNHTFFKTAYVLGMLVLVQENIFTVLTPLYNVVEVNIFDEINYFFARIMIKASNRLRQIQTGNLNLNMLMVLAFFLLCLMFLSLGSL